MLTRTREQLVRQCSKVSNQILAKIRYLGLRVQDLPDHVGKRFIAQLLAAPLPSDVHSSLKAMATVWEAINQEIKIIDKKIAEQTKHDGERETIYRSALLLPQQDTLLDISGRSFERMSLGRLN